MRQRNRAVVALGATLGLVLTALAVASPAHAGHQNDTTFDTTTLVGDGPQGGTLTNGVGWSVDKGQGPSEQGYVIYPSDGTQTYTFTKPVTLTFGVAGLNCSGEAIELQEGIVPLEVNDRHTWDPATRILSRNGSGPADTSRFTSSGPVTSFSIRAVGAPTCGRGVAMFEVGYLDNQTPTATIAAPVDGGVFPQGAVVPASYSCSDGDTVHVDQVDCVGDVPNGEPIDTSTVGSHTFTVTATDEHGAASSRTVSYTVGPQRGMCSGVAVGLPLNIDLGAANAGGTPCVTDSGKVIDLELSLGTLPFPLTQLSPSLTVKAAHASSTKDGNTHKAAATVANVKIAVPLNGYALELKDLWSEVSASTPGACGAGNVIEGQVEIGRIVRNNTFLYNRLNNPLSIDIPLLGGVHLNQVKKTGRQVEANAVAIDLPGGLLDINIGSSRAGVDC